MIKKQADFATVHFLLVVTLLIGVPVAGQRTEAQQPASTNQIIPLIVLDQVPLSDAIKNLARQAGINYILDPRISVSKSMVSGRWQNETAEQLLGTVLQDHKLVMVENSATSVARIASANQGVKPVSPSQVGTDTTGVVPVIALEDVPLDEAIKRLAVQADLKVSLDPKLSGNSSGQTARALPTVTFRWEKLSARQALAALLDNYDLSMVEDPTTSVARIMIKQQGDNKPSPSGESGQG